MTDEENRKFALEYVKDAAVPLDKKIEKAKQIEKYIKNGESIEVKEDTKSDDQLLTE